MVIDYGAIGRRVRIARIKKKLSQRQLANVADVSDAHISNIETGKSKVALPTLMRIANALSVSADDLLCDNIIYTKPAFERRIADILEDCDPAEIRAIAEIAEATKNALRNRAEIVETEKEIHNTYLLKL